MRVYIEKNISIDGRNIPYTIVTACDYLEVKFEFNEEQIEEFCENNYDVYKIITQILALKQSCYLMRRVSYSCGSLSEGLYDLKNRLIRELSEKYKFEFDDELVESHF